MNELNLIQLWLLTFIREEHHHQGVKTSNAIYENAQPTIEKSKTFQREASESFFSTIIKFWYLHSFAVTVTTIFKFLR